VDTEITSHGQNQVKPVSARLRGVGAAQRPSSCSCHARGRNYCSGSTIEILRRAAYWVVLPGVQVVRAAQDS
jgi:hypothetical protein